MIIWLAKRTLTAKEFTEFINEFAEKSNKDNEYILKKDDYNELLVFNKQQTADKNK